MRAELFRLLRKAQIWTILRLWGKVPIRTMIITYCTDGTVHQRFRWIDNDITRLGDSEEMYVTDKYSLYFIMRWPFLVLPALMYAQDRICPLRVLE